MGKRRKYSAEFKREAVGLANDPGVTKSQIAGELDINATGFLASGNSWIRTATYFFKLFDTSSISKRQGIFGARVRRNGTELLKRLLNWLELDCHGSDQLVPQISLDIHCEAWREN